MSDMTGLALLRKYSLVKPNYGHNKFTIQAEKLATDYDKKIKALKAQMSRAGDKVSTIKTTTWSGKLVLTPRDGKPLEFTTPDIPAGRLAKSLVEWINHVAARIPDQETACVQSASKRREAVQKGKQAHQELEAKLHRLSYDRDKATEARLADERANIGANYGDDGRGNTTRITV